MAEENALVLREIVKCYKSGSKVTEALRGVSLTVKQGEFLAITGKSGCGKSTLLNIMGGMDRQTSGEYLFQDRSVSGMSGRELAKFRNANIGFVFQAFHLAKELNLVDNVAMPLGYANVGGKERRRRAKEALTRVGLEEKFRSHPSQLSGGQQQRAAIARAIVNQPDILLADEPTGNLDSENGLLIMDLMKELNRAGLTIVMVTHDLDLAKQADRIIRMEDGRIVQ